MQFTVISAVRLSAQVSLCLLLLMFAGGAIAQQQTDEEVIVRITGLNDEQRSNLLPMLSIYSLHQQTAPRPFRLRYLHRQAPAEIQTALQPLGYYHVEVESTLERKDGTWQASYQINPGQPTRVEAIDITRNGEAANDPAFSNLLNKLPLKRGDIFRHDQYEQMKNQLRSLAAERGYYEARLTTQRAKVELTEHAARIEITLSSGPRFSFGPVSFAETPLRTSLLERYLNFNQGDPFSNRQLLDLQVALADSDYFSVVEVAPQYDAAEQQQIPVSVDLEPSPRQRYRFGIGYGTDTGARITLGHDRRWVNDRGHQLNGIVQLSEVRTTGRVNYLIPGENPATDHYSINGEISDKSYEQQRAQIYRLGVSDLRQFSNWQRTYALDWQQEDFRYGDTLEGSSRFLIPSVSWTLLQADDRFVSTEGYRVALTLKGGSDSGLSDTDFASVIAAGKYVHPLTEKWRVLARAELAATYVEDFSELSPSLRFFAGGDNSVRGYAYEQLGPEDADGVVTGGRYLAVGSLEFDYEFKPNWRVAVFTDIGNAMLEPSEPLKQSVGIGIRWVSPIGSVRLDVAQAIDEPDKPWRLSFTLGPDL